MECDSRALHHLPGSEAAAFATAENGCHADHASLVEYLRKCRKKTPAATFEQQE